ncbi:MAG: flavin reductase [Acetobacter sp.]|jgi:flavin reductase
MQREVTATVTESVSPELFREAMSRLGAPVTIVTTDGPAGRHGLTLSAITSVTDTPPTVLVCLNRTNRSHQAFLQNGVIGINILGQLQSAVADAFASSRRTSDEKFAIGVWREGRTGAPVLNDATVTLECSIADIRTSGSHDVLFCTIEHVSLHHEPDGGLAWFDRRYHLLPRLRQEVTGSVTSEAKV